eukprot:9531959-Prorocentrum_lima.AAC.1
MHCKCQGENLAVPSSRSKPLFNTATCTSSCRQKREDLGALCPHTWPIRKCFLLMVELNITVSFLHFAFL